MIEGYKPYAHAGAATRCFALFHPDAPLIVTKKQNEFTQFTEKILAEIN